MGAAKPPTAQELSTFTQRTGFAIPTTARASRFYSQTGWMDDSFAIQFAIPAAEFQPFLASSPLPADTVRGGSGSSMALSAFRAWLPQPPTSFQYADTIIAPGRAVRAVFDFDDPQTTTIYLVWFET